MIPLLAIGGAIGALMSIGKGASWVADKLAPTHEAGATSGKSAGAPQSAQSAAFETALAAQAAGQAMPGAVPPPSSLPGSIIPLAHGTDYDVRARIEAGIAAYGNVGERHGAADRGAKTHDDVDNARPPVVNGDGSMHKTSVIAGS